MGVSCFTADKNKRSFQNRFEKYTDELLKGSMMVVLEGDKFTYYRRTDLNYNSKKLLEIKEKFYLEKPDLELLWDFFKQLNEDKTGFITIDDLYILIKEKQSNSIVAPYLDRFFVIIEKRFNEKIAFEELLPYLISYCLSSIFQIIKFVFEFADKNKHGYITRKDVLDLVDVKREDQHIYLQNHSIAISQIAEFNRNDRINLEDFVELCNRMPFVYFPAIQLQKALRKYYIGNGFWESFHSKTIEKHKKYLKEKAEQKIKEKIEGYKKKIEKKNEVIDNGVKGIFMNEVRMFRKNSDTNFYLNYKYKPNLNNSKKQLNSSKNINLFM